jgi:hypothetical protein
LAKSRYALATSSAGASFSANPDYFDPEHIVNLAIEAGCNGVTSTLGVLGMMSRKYAHHIPMVVKLNHNQMLDYPNAFDQIMFAQVQQAFDLPLQSRRDHYLNPLVDTLIELFPFKVKKNMKKIVTRRGKAVLFLKIADAAPGSPVHLQSPDNPDFVTGCQAGGNRGIQPFQLAVQALHPVF